MTDLIYRTTSGEQAAATPTRQDVDTLAGQTWRVVVVDDNSDDRAEIRRLLLKGSERHYQMTSADSGEAGVRAVLDPSEGLPDCVILDYFLPDMSAIDILRALSGPDGLTVCPVVVLTGNVEGDVGRQVLRAGAQDYIGKSWLSVAALTRSVENAVERYQMARELSARTAGLAENERRFHVAAETARFMIYDFCPRTKRVNCLQGLQYLLGFREEDAERTLEWWDARIEPSDLEIRQEAFRRIQVDHLDQKIEYRVRHKDGRVLWVEDRLTAIHDEYGILIRLLGTIVDINGRKRAEEDLRQSHEAFHKLVEDNPFGILLIDSDFRLIQTSLGAKKVFENLAPYDGRDFGELLRAMWPEPFADEVIARFRHTLESGESYHSPRSVERRLDLGDVESYDWRIERVALVDGQIGVVCYFYDLSERYRSESALRSREQELLSLTSKSPDILTRFDRELRHVFVSDAVEEATGLRREDILGKSNRELGMPSADCDEWDAKLLAVFQTGQSQSIAFSFEGPVGERHYSGRLAPEFSSDGEVEFVIAAVHDVTDLKRVNDEALVESEDRLRLALAAAHAGAWDWNIITGVTAWSPENYALHRVDPNVGPPSLQIWIETIHPDDLEHVKATVRDTLEGRTPEFRDEYRVVHPTLGDRWLLGIGQVKHGPDGKPAHMIGINIDITERKMFEQAMADHDRRKDEFLATLAHELRNPLAPIRSGLELMKQAPCLMNSNFVDCREMMERQVNHMVRLVDDLLDVSRIRTDKLELKRELLKVETILEHAIESSRPLIDGAHHQLLLQATDGPLWVDGDLTRLSQVLGNLLNNAAKYTPDRGIIELSTYVDGEHVAISVRDNGPGIPREMLLSVFGMFTQVETGMNRAKGGLGIGLSIVKRLVEKHGGTIEAESQGLGLGSTFTIRLPRARPQDDAASRDSPRSVATMTHRRSPLSILVVDDNRDAAKSMARLMKLWGHSVRVANEGAEAIEAALDQIPDLIFLDIGMPGMDGYEVCRRLRALASLSGATIVALTGWGSDEDKRQTNLAGFDRHLVKPIAPDQLKSLLREAGDCPNGGGKSSIDA